MAVDLAETGVKVHVVAPAVIDTELFHLPDNDPAMTDDVEALPVDAMVEPVVQALDAGTFEIYVPDFFREIVIGKFQNPDGFLEGTIAYTQSKRGN
jgi:short-subunit dehydrogenase